MKATDMQLVKVARQQSELFRLVSQGNRDANLVSEQLQAIIEGRSLILSPRTPEQRSLNELLQEIKTMVFFQKQGEIDPVIIDKCRIYRSRRQVMEDMCDKIGRNAKKEAAREAIVALSQFDTTAANGAAEATQISVLSCVLSQLFDVDRMNLVQEASDDAYLLAAAYQEQKRLESKHVFYLTCRWSLWRAGYGVYCDLDGMFCIYERP